MRSLPDPFRPNSGRSKVENACRRAAVRVSLVGATFTIRACREISPGVASARSLGKIPFARVLAHRRL